MPMPLRPRRIMMTFLVVLLAACFFLGACGSSDTTGTTPGGSSETTVVTLVPSDAGPEVLAQAVTHAWAQTMQQLVTILEGKPGVSVAMPQVQALKESAIQTLVGLGHHRETLSTADRARTDSLEWAAFDELCEESWYTTYHELWQYYQGLDLDFANLISGFNILTQYSDFTLLKQQLPDEAARLGVE